MDLTKDFFLSYNKADKHWATWIAWQLEEAGYTTVLQSWDFQPGGNFVLEMDDATKQATPTIALLSPDYFTSQYTSSGWAVASRRDPKGEQGLLLPIRVRLCDVEGLLGPIGYIDLVDKNEASARTALLTGVERKRRKPASAPTFPPVAHAEAEQPAFPGGLLDVGKPHPQPARFGLPFPELWNVPRRHSIFFTGRGRLLDQQARAIREQQLGLRHPETAATLDGLARLYRVQGKYEQAEQLYRQALKIWQQVLASTHPRIANSLHNLALLYADRGRYERAEVLYQQSLAILMPGERKVVGELLSFTR